MNWVLASAQPEKTALYQMLAHHAETATNRHGGTARQFHDQIGQAVQRYVVPLERFTLLRDPIVDGSVSREPARPLFSSRRCSLVVPGIGTIHVFRDSSQASAFWAAVACLAAAMRASSSTKIWFALRASGVALASIFSLQCSTCCPPELDSMPELPCLVLGVAGVLARPVVKLLESTHAGSRKHLR